METATDASARLDPAYPVPIARILSKDMQIRTWVSHSISRERSDESKAATLTHWIRIGKHLHTLQNFHCLAEIIGALTDEYVSSLAKVWSTIPSKRMQSFEYLRSFVEADLGDNYGQFVTTITPPCIPPYGKYMGNLLYTDQNTADYIGDMVNFDKRRHMARVIFEMETLTKVPYLLEAVPDIHEYIDICLSTSVTGGPGTSSAPSSRSGSSADTSDYSISRANSSNSNLDAPSSVSSSTSSSFEGDRTLSRSSSSGSSTSHPPSIWAPVYPTMPTSNRGHHLRNLHIQTSPAHFPITGRASKSFEKDPKGKTKKKPEEIVVANPIGPSTDLGARLRALTDPLKVKEKKIKAERRNRRLLEQKLDEERKQALELRAMLEEQMRLRKEAEDRLQQLGSPT